MTSNQHQTGAYCYRIKGLHVPFTTPADIEKNINNYIDKIEGLTGRIENSFLKGDISDFIKGLEEVKSLLQSVYAIQCESHASALIEAASLRTLDYCKKVYQQAIADFLLLSIEMQKAQYINSAEALRYKKIERNEDIAKNLSAVSRMLRLSNYDKAMEVINTMKDEEYTFDKLSAMIKNREYDRAKELASTMEKEHVEHIENAKGGNTKTNKTVLAVDDRPEILQSVSAALRNHFKVLGAPSGKIALDIIGKNNIDLFFLDIDMPEMTGIELLEKIRAHKDHKNTPVVFLTANATRENILKVMKHGVNEFIVKPANNLTLLAKARANID